MLIERKSPISGKIQIRDLPITDSQMIAWENGALIHEVMPQLSVDDREWLINGTTKEDWDWLMEGIEE